MGLFNQLWGKMFSNNTPEPETVDPLPTGYIRVKAGKQKKIRWFLYGATSRENHDAGGTGQYLDHGPPRGRKTADEALNHFYSVRDAMVGADVRVIDQDD